MYQKRTKRQEQKEQTKWKVYHCARALFQEKGFDNVTMDEIAEKAGVSVGTIYFHYKSKHEILANYHAELDEAYVEYFQRQRETAEYEHQNNLQRIHDFLVFCCEISANLGLENIRVVYPYMMCNESFGSRMLNVERPYYCFMQELVENGQAAGEIRGDMPVEMIINDLTVLVRGCIMDWCIHGGQTDIRPEAERLLGLLLLSLGAV